MDGATQLGHTHSTQIQKGIEGEGDGIGTNLLSWECCYSTIPPNLQDK